MLVRYSCYLLAIATTFSAVAWSGAASPANITEGKALFEREWPSRNPRLGSDGLGPLFNGPSCVACHHQGGSGGGGAAEFNANTIGIESMQIKGPSVTNDVIANMVASFHPGFVSDNGTVINTFTIPHRGGSSLFQELNAKLYQHVPTERADFGGSSSAAEVRHSYATPILFSAKQGKHRISIRARLFQRNTTSLFGAGLIDGVPEKEIVAQAKAQKSHPEINGRPSTLRDGRIGKFGWRGNVGSLVEFVDQACANEIGLETRRKPQARDPLNRGYQNPANDISDEQIEKMSAFIAALPAPVRRHPVSTEERDEVLRGEKVFASIGCAVCHVPNLGGARGIYSDLLLHEMGNELIDLNHAEPYVVRRTPIARQSYTESVTTELFSGGMGSYYGSTTSIRSTDPGMLSAIPTRVRTRPMNRHNFSFTAPDYPTSKLSFIDLSSEQEDLGTEQGTIAGGRRQIRQSTSRLDLYIRVHYEPTLFNQEWRTPPLWGVADSAPYMHDGRAETLLEAVTMHDGEASGTRDRFLNLPLQERRSVIAFMESLVAPPSAPPAP